MDRGNQEMKLDKFSINKACIILGTFFVVISIIFIVILYCFIEEIAVVWYGLLYIIVAFSCVLFFIMFVRRKLTQFSDTLCESLDEMMTEKIEPPEIIDEESLFYKINHRLSRLYEIMSKNRQSIAKERADLQELISDISHQVKTPIANLKIVNTTLLEQNMSKKKQQEFLIASNSQLDKLDFLMQALVKTSRLETGIISLEKKYQPIYDTLAVALGGIFISAEKKCIHIKVDCEEDLSVSHDRKWTSEALFNILDNAVKYTLPEGDINVSVECWEMYLKINISDTGKGILEQNQGAIFKRFYREERVHDVEGIGIGLYLAREIITMQGGYIIVDSEVEKGSIFSVSIPR